MSILSKVELHNKMSAKENCLVISPILDDTQIGLSSIDLRVGTEFKVSIHSRRLAFGVVQEDLDTFYQTTYRNFGEEIIIYPNQQVLADSFEYVRLPQDCSAMLMTRSSLQRIGLSTSSLVQPGYAGTLTVPLENKSNIPIVIKSGMRLFQLVVYKLRLESEGQSYIEMQDSKYIGNTSPVISAINRDADLKKLEKFVSE
ncbi:dCTP deaminase [Vagococcus sp. BWB3-3]|uniref:dCTP deaminase n=1 Tax=Vagococcus allomyrinae TaxID=2794353 RepID=A0A940PF74_9ENTE|nr:dCTP deaminase [Vagococcus allomyrinae]MBP1042426.1 dCTP deaminase [Vagococcus allomyrinae]